MPQNIRILLEEKEQSLLASQETIQVIYYVITDIAIKYISHLKESQGLPGYFRTLG